MTDFNARAGVLSALIAALMVEAPAAQSAPKAKTHRGSVQPTDSEIRRSSFSGNETQLRLFWWINADCSSGIRPDIRIVRAPSHGEMTFKQVYSVVELVRTSPLARCNGQPVDAVGMFYTSEDDFAGQERMTVDVDYRQGTVHRHTVVVDVR